MGVIGYYDRSGYRVESNGREMYAAGKHPLDSTFVLDPDDPDALSLFAIERSCRQTAREFAQERNERFIGVERLD